MIIVILCIFMALMTWAAFHPYFMRYIRRLSHQKLKSLSKDISSVKKERFNENHGKQLEIERSFSDEEFGRFMAVVTNPWDRAAFMLMATLALRPCEICAIRGRDISDGHIRIQGAKGSYSGCFALPKWLEAIIPCSEPEELIFPASKTLRFHFRLYRKFAGLENCYMLTKPCGRRMKQNHRYRISLHSFRHYGIQKFYERTRDPELTRAFARHKDMKSTQVYMKKALGEEVNEVLKCIYVSEMAAGS